MLIYSALAAKYYQRHESPPEQQISAIYEFLSGEASIRITE